MQTLAFDVENFKRASLTQWEQAASGWNAYSPQVHAWLEPATHAMLNMAGIERGHRVLDVAAGAGDQTLDIARRVGAGGSVVAVDFSPAILRFAAENASRGGCVNVETLVADAERMQLPPDSFDAAVCRLGLMLFADPLSALRAMHHALKPRARICTMVFSTPDANPCVAAVMATALQHAGVAARDPFQPGSLFSLGKPGVIDGLFTSAGFREIATTRIKALFKLPDARDYLSFVRSSASPVQQILAKLDPGARDAAWAAMEERLRAFQTAHGWEGPNELLLTAAERA
jgi:ubiquinone/menaquinone biosynthesis C-methylase UbiE